MIVNEAWDRFCHDVGDALYDWPDERDEDGDGVDEEEETEGEEQEWNA